MFKKECMDLFSVADFSTLHCAQGRSEVGAFYKVLPEDFIVEECIAFDLTGEGEHLWCWVEKKGENTNWVVQQLAKWANIPVNKVCVAGQKDRHAVTRQWFSLHLPKQIDPAIECFQHPHVTILKTVRHHRKLQKGGLSGNRFVITMRYFHGHASSDDIQLMIQSRLQGIQACGVPNYFGAQRFGLNGGNLKQGARLLSGKLRRVKRHQKSLYVSAIRSWMFNVLLSHRVANESWNTLLKGDVLQLQGSNKWFLEDGSFDLKERVANLDLHPTGALYGLGELPTQYAARALEQQVAQTFIQWVSGVQQYGVKQDRRALRVLPLELEWQWLDEADKLSGLNKTGDAQSRLIESFSLKAMPALRLSFTLCPGSYATMVLRELCQAMDYPQWLKHK